MRKNRLICCVVACLVFFTVACGQPEGPDKAEHTQAQDVVAESGNESVENTSAPADDVSEPGWEETAHVECVVQVQTDNQRGSGVLWDKQEDFWCFVTAAHVVEGLEQAEIYFPEVDKMCVTSVHCVEGLDLAFLQVDAELLTEEIEAAYGECKEVSSEVESGDSIYARGYNASAKKLEFVGSVWEPWIYTEDFSNYMLMCQCEAQAGMSGGGVFTEDDALAGIVCGQNEDGMLAVLPTVVIESEYNLFINY